MEPCLDRKDDAGSGRPASSDPERGTTCLRPDARISAIVPVLDEEERIGTTLGRLAGVEGILEVIVVDGGSRDATVAAASRAEGVVVLQATRGRASQMNEGARVARGDVLLFLHADVELPPRAGFAIAAALSDREVVAGAFRTWTIDDVGAPRWLVPFLHLADLRSRYSGLPYGDQAMFVRAEVFRELGGFPRVRLMEDLEMSRALRRRGRIRIVRESVRVSGRRFVRRPLYYLAIMNLLPLLHRLGIPPERLARFYPHER